MRHRSFNEIMFFDSFEKNSAFIPLLKVVITNFPTNFEEVNIWQSLKNYEKKSENLAGNKFRGCQKRCNFARCYLVTRSALNSRNLLPSKICTFEVFNCAVYDKRASDVIK